MVGRGGGGGAASRVREAIESPAKINTSQTLFPTRLPILGLTTTGASLSLRVPAEVFELPYLGNSSKTESQFFGAYSQAGTDTGSVFLATAPSYNFKTIGAYAKISSGVIDV